MFPWQSCQGQLEFAVILEKSDNHSYPPERQVPRQQLVADIQASDCAKSSQNGRGAECGAGYGRGGARHHGGGARHHGGEARGKGLPSSHVVFLDIFIFDIIIA